MPRTIALIYLACGALWIFFTDRLLAWLHVDAETVLTSLSGVTLAAGEPAQREQAGKVLDLVVDGLRRR